MTVFQSEGDRVIIQVTAHDINNGIKGECNKCPIALAILRATNNDIERYRLFGNNYVSVSTRTVYIGETRYYLPREAKQFIKDFDDNMEVEPFEFELNEIEEVF